MTYLLWYLILNICFHLDLRVSMANYRFLPLSLSPLCRSLLVLRPRLAREEKNPSTQEKAESEEERERETECSIRSCMLRLSYSI